MTFILFILSFIQVEANQPKNLIYIIVDGMGPSIVTGTRVYAYGANGKLTLEQFPVTGIAKTYSSDYYVTDSAASATALASGVKTYNNAIGYSDSQIDPTKKPQKLQTIMDLAAEKGMATGVVTTARVTHATPAAFYAHALHRDQEDSIAAQLKDSPLTILLGGGAQHFQAPKLEELKNRGWAVVSNNKELSQVDLNKNVLGIFHASHMTYQTDRQKNKVEKSEPTLLDMTKIAIKKLSQNKNGYFLMIESGRVDHAAHENLAIKAFEEMLELERVVKFLFKTLGNETLIVLTADHDTGALGLNGYGALKKVKKEVLFGNRGEEDGPTVSPQSYLSWATGPGYASPESSPKKFDPDYKHKATYNSFHAAHSGVDVYVLARGLGSENFMGFMNNHEIPHKILSSFQLKFTDNHNLTNKIASDKL
jgi:alkaline phosphatase